MAGFITWKGFKSLFVSEVRSSRNINEQQYLSKFEGKEVLAFTAAMEARKFEIQLYWTRTAYFWTLSGAALAGFFASLEKLEKIHSFVIACIGVILSLGWALANKGSKYWQENWENHVQMLEDHVIGPLHKVHLHRDVEPLELRYDLVSQLVTGPSGFSVSKINSIFSWFFFFMWFFLAFEILPKTSIGEPFEVNWRYACAVAVTAAFVYVLARFSRSWVDDQEHVARVFTEVIIAPGKSSSRKAD